MGMFSFWHWLVVVLVFVLPTVLFSKIVVKAGFPVRWALLGLIPVVNVVALWMFAFGQWPKRPA